MASPRNFRALLDAQMAAGKMVCVGLDSDSTKLKGADQLEFNRRIVDATWRTAQSYKIQVSMYEAEVNPTDIKSYYGWYVIQQTVAFINQIAPHIPVILDFKRGDIDNSNLGYIRLAFERFGVDAVTVNPFMGRVKGMQPFLDQKGKGIIVLCRTSNDGGAEFQDITVTTYIHEPTGVLYASLRHAEIEFGKEEYEEHAGEFHIGPSMPFYEYVAYRVTDAWNGNGNCCVVVGATNPGELARVRSIVGKMPILIPGLGAQGGDEEATIEAGLDEDGQGVIVNNSRGVIFADDPRQAGFDFHTRLSGLRVATMAKRASA